MLKLIFPQRPFFPRGRRRPFLAMAFLITLLTLCIVPAGAFAQDQQEAPPPPSDQQSEHGMGRRMGRGQMPSRGRSAQTSQQQAEPERGSAGETKTNPRRSAQTDGTDSQ